MRRILISLVVAAAALAVTAASAVAQTWPSCC